MARHRGLGRAYPGRHRYGLPGLIHCLHLPAVQLRLSWRLSGWLPTRHDLAGASRRVPAVPLARAVRPAQPAQSAQSAQPGQSVQHAPAADWTQTGRRLAA